MPVNCADSSRTQYHVALPPERASCTGPGTPRRRRRAARRCRGTRAGHECGLSGPRALGRDAGADASSAPRGRGAAARGRVRRTRGSGVRDWRHDPHRLQRPGVRGGRLPEQLHDVLHRLLHDERRQPGVHVHAHAGASDGARSRAGSAARSLAGPGGTTTSCAAYPPRSREPARGAAQRVTLFCRRRPARRRAERRLVQVRYRLQRNNSGRRPHLERDARLVCCAVPGVPGRAERGTQRRTAGTCPREPPHPPPPPAPPGPQPPQPPLSPSPAGAPRALRSTSPCTMATRLLLGCAPPAPTRCTPASCRRSCPASARTSCSSRRPPCPVRAPPRAARRTR